jgi:thiamine pyrophosphokinase
MRAIIFANGILTDPAQARAVVQPGDLIIAADGGARHLQALQLTPEALIGDFDSLSAEELAALESSGAQVIRHPARKDYTDLELALEYALARGASQVQILAALGNRWDQTLANLLLAGSERFSGAQINLLDGPQELHLLRAGQTITLHGQPGDTLSLIPLAGDAHGITTHDLEYSLKRETLGFGSTRGISNVLLGSSARVELGEGMLVCVVIHM